MSATVELEPFDPEWLEVRHSGTSQQTENDADKTTDRAKDGRPTDVAT